ncbi:hypothetical protein Syun_027716 [Stephania yunnanensis]|uniref:BZIP domain-containing protein n=1 Tax=Stephania yunnanensis TaxID=152371 RepID=A0AAP0HRI2_9MAGN
MAELPPKIPNPSQGATSISDHHHHAIHVMGDSLATSHSHRPWVDEFLHFTAAKRNAHRTLSDSIAFFESPLIEKCDGSSIAMLRSHGNEFDGLDDEQLMTMFSDDISGSTTTNVPQTFSSSNPSTSSDRYSINGDDQNPSMDSRDHQNHHQQQLRNEVGEVESSCKPDLSSQALPPPISSSGEPIRDPKRVKRILANRQSAQRSRVRKLQYISELERSVTSLQTEVSALSPRVAYLDHQRLILNVDNSALKQRIAALAQDKIFKDAHQEALKKEIQRLRQMYHQQSLKKMSHNTCIDAKVTEDKGEDNNKKESEQERGCSSPTEA